jgi:hypothetical protein
MSRGPERPERQELLVGCCRFFVLPAIAEYPGTQIGDFFFFGLQIEGTSGALDCNVAAILVVERLAQLTIDQGSLVIGNIAAPEMNKTFLEVARRSRADYGLPDLANVVQLGDTLGWRAEFHGGELAARYSERDRRAGCVSLATAASVGSSPHVWSDPHLFKCAQAATQHAVRSVITKSKDASKSCQYQYTSPFFSSY